ncbi:glycosyltransferase family 2 protein [Candidatus Parcubacteria bacterium]|nr:MAG: glycosyltransferase family 2 protein [Candidatus Parcubacteria bacterium]
MQFKPTFSVITATYNRGYILWRAIQSVLAQTFPFFELIVVDDGSRDNTEQVVKVFTDPRLRYFKLPKNQGPSAARNFGLKKAKADLVAYLDSDNVWHADFLETMHRAFKKHPDKVLVFCKKNYRLTLIEEDGKETPVRDEITNHRKYFDLKRLWHRRIIIDTNSMCHKRKEIIRLGGWDEKIKFWEDWELTLRISKKYPKGFLYLNRALLDYEQKIDLKKAHRVFALWEQEEKKIFLKHQGHPLLEGQQWFPPTQNKSTLGVVEYLRRKKDGR